MAQQLPRSLGPRELVEQLFWFAQRVTVQQITAWTDVDRGTVRKVHKAVRLWLVQALATTFTGLLGGPGLVVVVDETLVSRRKRSRALRGRWTRPMQIWVVGGVELDLATRKVTGRAFLRLVQNRSRETIERILRTVVRPGAELWTDDWGSYGWLDEPGARLKPSDPTGDRMRSPPKLPGVCPFPSVALACSS